MEIKTIYIFLSFIVFALFSYLIFLLRQIYINNKKKKLAYEKNKSEIIESVRIISLATVQNQCDLSEACIRLQNLMKRNEVVDKFASYIPVVEEMYQEIKDFAYLDERAKLSKQEKFKQDNKRFVIEEKFNNKFRKNLNQLLKAI